jgi:hypothetical protein
MLRSFSRVPIPGVVGSGARLLPSLLAAPSLPKQLVHTFSPSIPAQYQQQRQQQQQQHAAPHASTRAQLPLRSPFLGLVGLGLAAMMTEALAESTNSNDDCNLTIGDDIDGVIKDRARLIRQQLGKRLGRRHEARMQRYEQDRFAPKCYRFDESDDVSATIEHTLLKPQATSDDIRKLVQVCVHLTVRDVCLFPPH